MTGALACYLAGCIDWGGCFNQGERGTLHEIARFLAIFCDLFSQPSAFFRQLPACDLSSFATLDALACLARRPSIRPPGEEGLKCFH
jgi:hypothetical protein